MLTASARLLELLALLQSRRDWTGVALSERLGVTPRTVRRDVERLRNLSYLVLAAPGVAGGYRLGAGAAVPPLLLDDEEAVAVAISLRTAAGGTVTGIEETALRALTKLEQVLPSRLRYRVSALQAATISLAAGTTPVRSEALAAIAASCRNHEQLRFGYTDREDRSSTCHVEPHRLVHTGRRWYLVARDVDKQEWRTFRVDRMTLPASTGARFHPVDPPDAALFVANALSAAPYRYLARIRLQVPVETAATRIPQTAGVLEQDGDDACILTTGADSLTSIAAHLLMLEVDFHILDPPELIAQTRRLAVRLYEAGKPGRAPSPA